VWKKEIKERKEGASTEQQGGQTTSRGSPGLNKKKTGVQMVKNNRASP